jgi:hypothetical protein
MVATIRTRRARSRVTGESTIRHDVVAPVLSIGCGSWRRRSLPIAAVSAELTQKARNEFSGF